MEQTPQTQSMEEVLRHFTARIADEQPDSINAMMRAEFISCSYEARELLLRFPIKPWMTNPNGVVHGGVSATALDIAMGGQAYFWGGEQKFTSTVSMTINYLRPVAVEGAIIARSKVVSHGRTTTYATAEIWAEGAEDRILLTATGIYHIPHN